jgi:hypothetical protein
MNVIKSFVKKFYYPLDNKCCNTLEDCVENDHFECLKIKIGKKKLKYPYKLFVTIIYEGRLDMLKYIMDKELFYITEITRFPFRPSEEELIQVYEECAKFYSQMVDIAGFLDKLDILQYIFQKHKNNIDVHFCPHAGAAIRGHLECFKYIIENVKDFGIDDYNSIQLACQFGQLNILEYAHLNGCAIPESDVFLSMSIEKDYFDCVEYCLKNELYTTTKTYIGITRDINEENKQNKYEYVCITFYFCDSKKLNIEVLQKYTCIRNLLLKHKDLIFNHCKTEACNKNCYDNIKNVITEYYKVVVSPIIEINTGIVPDVVNHILLKYI